MVGKDERNTPPISVYIIYVEKKSLKLPQVSRVMPTAVHT